MSVQTWVDSARKNQYNQKPHHQQTIEILSSLFTKNTDVDTAASQINSVYKPLLQEPHRNSPVNELWGLICEAVRQLGRDLNIDGLLVDLLNALTKLPDITDKNGHPVAGGNGVDGVFWRDLPNLAVMFREYGIDVDPGDSELPDNEGDWTDAQRSTLMNATTFGALYLARGIYPIGMDRRAEDALMAGIEDYSYDTADEHRRAATVVPPAATWLLLASEKIYELCKNDYMRREDMGRYGRGYSLARWSVWKQKFVSITAIDELEQSVRDIAEKAVSEMDRIDGGSN